MGSTLVVGNYDTSDKEKTEIIIESLRYIYPDKKKFFIGDNFVLEKEELSELISTLIDMISDTNNIHILQDNISIIEEAAKNQNTYESHNLLEFLCIKISDLLSELKDKDSDILIKTFNSLILKLTSELCYMMISYEDRIICYWT